MIEAQELTGYISQDKVLTGELSKTIEVLKPITQEKEVIPTKETQIIEPDKDFTGLSRVTVQSIPNEYIVPSGEIEFTQNGTYDVTDKASAKVNIKEKVLGTKTITSNGTYKAIDDNLDGYSEVEVNTGKYTPRTISFTNYTGTELTYETKNIDTSKITSMADMFKNCQKLTILDLSNFNTSNVTNMSLMFYDCYKLSNLDLSNFDTSKVTRFDYMFYKCYALPSLDLSSFDTSNATRMDEMFDYCQKLTNLNLSNFVTSKVTNFNHMFSNCEILQTLTFDNIDTSDATNFSGMFYNCRMILTIPTLNGSKATFLSSLFYNCFNLTNFNGIINLGQAYSITQNANYYNYTLDISSSYRNLTHESLVNIINNLYDIKTKGVKPQKLVLGTNNLVKLTEEERNIAVSKGWTLS